MIYCAVKVTEDDPLICFPHCSQIQMWWFPFLLLWNQCMQLYYLWLSMACQSNYIKKRYALSVYCILEFVHFNLLIEMWCCIILYVIYASDVDYIMAFWVITIYSYQIIERIVEFSRHQIVDVMSACDPAYRALHRPNENVEGSSFSSSRC